MQAPGDAADLVVVPQIYAVCAICRAVIRSELHARLLLRLAPVVEGLNCQASAKMQKRFGSANGRWTRRSLYRSYLSADLSRLCEPSFLHPGLVIGTQLWVRGWKSAADSHDLGRIRRTMAGALAGGRQHLPVHSRLGTLFLTGIGVFSHVHPGADHMRTPHGRYTHLPAVEREMSRS